MGHKTGLATTEKKNILLPISVVEVNSSVIRAVP